MSAVIEKKPGNKQEPETNAIKIGGSKGYCFVKRVFDFTAAAIGLVVLLIPMLIIALAIRLDSPGPAIYKQERLSMNRKPFILYKFRSMHLNAEENGPQWAAKDDCRTTRIGRVLRNTRLDELPQLLNILCGEMSFVGPRPEREYFYTLFETYIPDFEKRMLVKPGLTGWAQVNGGYDLEADEKIVFDLEYMRKRSLKMDVLCLLKTVKLVITHEGAR